MRSVPSDLAAELASGVTTLCRCWRIVRRDSLSFGFTDHDRDLTFQDVTYVARTGLEASEAVATLGFAVGSSEISGALIADAIREADIQAGLWDNASVEVWLVDWRDPTRRMLFDAGQIGEITRKGHSFTAEIRSLAHHYDQDKGRRYNALCSAELGDAQCGVDLTASNRRVGTVISLVSDLATFAITTIGNFAPGSLTQGRAIFSSNLPDEASYPILSHTSLNGLDVISLWSPPTVALTPGMNVMLQVGCDKRFDTCRERFSNASNYRGFPHLPGNDFLFSYARQGDAELDGSVVVR
jgi:uncharacterized phage protein (TIGR02218 family)